MRRTILFLSLFLLLLNISRPGEVNLTILKGEAVNEKKARLFVMIFDEAGIPVKGLSKENFSLKVGGEEIGDFELESISATESPLSIVLGIDVSGSMKGKPFSETRRSISRFLDQLDRKDYISLMSFGTEVTFLSGFTDKKYEIRGKMAGLAAADQWTHLYDATCEALVKIQKNAPTAKKAIALITDGKDTRSIKNRATALDKALNTGVPIFAIGYGREIDREYLREIGKISGGYFLFTPDPDEIGTLYDKVLDMLKNEYVVVFDFSKNPGRYMANVVLNYGGRAVEDYKEFLFNPAGGPIIISDTARDKDTAGRPWFRKVPLELVVLILAVLLIFIFVILWVRTKLTEKRFRQMTETVSKESSAACELEFPEDLDATKAGFIDSFAKAAGNGDTTKYTEMPEIYLQVEGFRGRIIPLLYRGADMLEELIIARKSADGKEQEYIKKSSAYLYAAPDRQVVSRPNENRCGHARIFFTGEEKYSVEDLGSKVGTFVNNEPIRGTGPAELQDGDVIEVGGKNGINIIYRETPAAGEEPSAE